MTRQEAIAQFVAAKAAKDAAWEAFQTNRDLAKDAELHAAAWAADAAYKVAYDIRRRYAPAI